MLQTHQQKLRQSCRELRAIKAGDLVESLRMTRNRQMQRRNKINHATSAQHASHIKNTNKICFFELTKTHQRNRRQSCRELRAFKARDFVVVLRMTRKRQMQRRNNINQETSAQNAPRTSHTHSTKQSLQ